MNKLGNLIRPWYHKEFPTDTEYTCIRADATFGDVQEALESQGNVYAAIGIGDSVIRERVFDELSVITNKPYDHIYDLWLRSA